MPYILETCKAGRTVEIRKYYSPKVAGIPEKYKRQTRQKPTPEKVKRNNLRIAEDKLRRMMNANFTDDDWSLTLTYEGSGDPVPVKDIRKDATNFVRRLRWTAAQFGVELKYIYCIGAGPHRRHIHILINAVPDMAIVSGCWDKGHVSMTKLYTKGQYRELAAYYIKNAEETRKQEKAEGIKQARRYNCSHNLRKPEIRKEVIKAKEFRKEPTQKKGYYLEKDSVYRGFNIFDLPILSYTLLQNERDYERDKHIYHNRRREKPRNRSHPPGNEKRIQG